jgi:puromycin-sensitive aminopeptidase
VEWAVVNAGGHGFYRVRYSGELLEMPEAGFVAPAFRRGTLRPGNDAWAAALAGFTPLADYLSLIELLADENDVNVWSTVIGSAHHLQRILDEAQGVELARRLRNLFAPAVARLGWAPKEGESQLESQLRGDLIGALGTAAEDESCQQRRPGVVRSI